MAERFTLTAEQVPYPCASEQWVDILRWCICVMDPADTRIGFVAGCLSHAFKNGGHLTDRQFDACDAIVQSLVEDWAQGVLVCQNTPPDRRKSTLLPTSVEVKH